MSSSTHRHDGGPSRRPALRRAIVALSLPSLLGPALLGTGQAFAEGSVNLYPTTTNCAPNSQNGSCRTNLEWRIDRTGAGTLYRRTLLKVFANAGEYILLGSSASAWLAAAAAAI